MGEAAEAAIWAEMNGRDPSDMSPEDWDEYFDDTAPSRPLDVYLSASVLALQLREHAGEEEDFAGVLAAMFPNLGSHFAEMLADGLKALVALPEPEDDV